MSDNPTFHGRPILEHWGLFGRKSTPPIQRVIGIEYKTVLFKESVASPWEQRIPRSEISKLLNGFAPREMEDKWIVYAEGPDEMGSAMVSMCRSWTRVCLVL